MAESNYTDRLLIGRTEIRTDAEEITKDNILEVMRKALSTHTVNVSDETYLWKYYLGDQPIRNRVKEVRPSINIRTVENHAYEFTEFDVGYWIGEPIQYISRNNAQEDVLKLNNYMLDIDKASGDNELVKWMSVVGTGYRLALPIDTDDDNVAPFDSVVLDPRNAFVVYSSGVWHEPMMGVTYYTNDENQCFYTAYTKDTVFKMHGSSGSVDAIDSVENHVLGMIPVIEYPLNKMRMGAWEMVIPLFNAINIAESDRLNGLAQYVQHLLVLHNVNIDDEQFESLSQMGGIAYKDVSETMKGEIKLIESELDQSNSETLVKHLYDAACTICGIPQRGDSTASGDNGIAVVYRNGFQTASSNAKNFEHCFTKSERMFLRLVLNICNAFGKTDLAVHDVQIKFTRRAYDNLQSKTQAFVQMITARDADGNGMVDPKLAFDMYDLFSDPALAYSMSAEYHDEEVKRRANSDTG